MSSLEPGLILRRYEEAFFRDRKQFSPDDLQEAFHLEVEKYASRLIVPFNLYPNVVKVLSAEEIVAVWRRIDAPDVFVAFRDLPPDAHAVESVQKTGRQFVNEALSSAFVRQGCRPLGDGLSISGLKPQAFRPPL